MTLSITIRLNNNKESNLVGFATVTVNEFIQVSGIKIWKNKDGLNVQMPGYSNKTPKKTFYNQYVRFTDYEHQKLFESAIIKEYKECLLTKSV